MDHDKEEIHTKKKKTAVNRKINKLIQQKKRIIVIFVKSWQKK